MARDSWYRLDNVGRFYSAQAGRAKQTVFRIAAGMSEDVDPDALQRALDRALDVFPGFDVTLRSGLFWHYLEQAKSKPKVVPEAIPPCAPMHAGPSSALVRVSYSGRRMNLEVSHMVSDGRGTMQLFRTLVAFYVQERYGAAVELEPYARDEAHKTEDSFSANYERKASGATAKPKAYRIRGWRDRGAQQFIEVHLSASQVRDAAKAMGVGLTPLLIAGVVCAVRGGMPKRDRRRGRAICITVPVDLRRFFGSETLRNFFGLAYVSYVPGACDETLAQVAADVERQLQAATQPEALKRRMNRMVKLQKNPALRLAPVFVKDAVLGVAARVAEREVTTVASNLGRVEMPKGTEGYVESVVVLTSSTGINFVMCTYGDDLCVGVSSVLVSNDIPRRFVRTFTGLGVDAVVDVNRTREEVDVALRQERMEHALLHAEEDECDRGRSLLTHGQTPLSSGSASHCVASSGLMAKRGHSGEKLRLPAAARALRGIFAPHAPTRPRNASQGLEQASARVSKANVPCHTPGGDAS